MPERGVRVLVVDNSPTDARLIAEMLGTTMGARFAVEAAPHVDAVLARLSGSPPDVLLLGCDPADAHGLMRQVRAETETLATIVMSERGDEDVVARAIEAGAEDGLVKGGFDREVLVRAIRYAIERKRALADRIQADEEIRLRTRALEAAANAVMITDTLGNIRWVNPAFTALTGYAASEVIGRSPSLLKSGKQDEAHYQRLWATITAGQVWSGQLVNRRKDGRLYTEEMTITPVRSEEGAITHFVAIKQDVTQRQEAEAARRESEERFRLQTETLQALLENIPVAVTFFDATGKLLFANRETERLLGWTAAEARETDLVAACYPDPADRKVVRDFVCAAAGVWKDFRTRTRDGRTIDTAWASVRLSDGTLVGVGQDLSERRRLESEYRQAQKMEAIGRLAGGVAHDFNNLLGVIIGYGELLKKRLPRTPQLLKYTDDILQAGQRAAGLTRQLLAFSRKQVLEPKVVDLNQVIPDIAKMIRRLIGEDIEMVVNLAPDLGQILADPGQLEQVIMNLAVNARDAMPDGGRFILETSNVELDASYARTHSNVVPGRYVLLAVTDTGSGMDAVTRAHAFEPFFTTKPAGKGTGLGLATVYGIVKQSGGDIWLYSEPGQGTVFKIYLPRIDAPAEREESDVQRHPLPGTETILLVEDDEALRLMTQDILQSNGYTVLSAAHPEEAVALSRAHPGPIDVLVSDVIMPGMNGHVLADRLLAERPTLKVLLVSGYTDDAVSSQALVDSGRSLLLKPFTEELLTRRVREAIDAPAGSPGQDGGRPSAS